MEVVDGKYTGDIDFYAYAENKAAAIRGARRSERGYDLARSYAYSDSITDVHMLEVVGPPVRREPGPDAAPAGRRPAAGRSSSSTKPVALRSRMRLPRASPRWPRWPSGRRPRWAARSTSQRVARSTAATLSTACSPRRHDLDKCHQPLWHSATRGVQRTQTTQDPHMSQVPTRRSTLPIGRWSFGSHRRQLISDARLVTIGLVCQQRHLDPREPWERCRLRAGTRSPWRAQPA